MNSGIKNFNTLFQRYLRYLTNFPESSLSHPLGVVQARRVYILFFISIIGILVLLPFGIIALIAKSYTLGMIDITAASTLAVNLLHARSYRNYNFNICVSIAFVAILFLYLFVAEGIENTGFIWYCTFPLIASFGLGSKKGALVTILTSLPIVILFLMKTPPSIFSNYSFYFKLRFSSSFLLIFIFSYIFVRSREKKEEELQSAHDDLEKRVDERTLALQEAIESLQREIRERTRAESALRESEAKFHRLFDEAPVGYHEYDTRGQIMRVNRTELELLGYSAEEVLGQCVWKFNDDEEMSQRAVLGKLAGTIPPGHGFERIYRRKDGTTFPVIIEDRPLRDSEGKIIGIRSTIQDITERKRAERVLKEKTEELARSNRDLEQFAYVASHDLQEPLRMVTNYMQLLARRYKGKFDSDADEFIGFAVDGAIRMRKLIDDLLTYSRVEIHGKELEPTDCETVFTQSLDNLKMAIEENNAKVTHDPLPTVMADHSQLEQLFQNLIGNAIKFQGNEPPRVHISAERNGSMWIFSVRDNGIGIAPEYAERIFVIFQRLHNRKEYAGTGIGLAICKKIVERHGGQIWVESEVGKGATFYFTLPASKGS